MRFLLAPAIGLINRLSFHLKFILLGVVSFAAIGGLLAGLIWAWPAQQETQLYAVGVPVIVAAALYVYLCLGAYVAMMDSIKGIAEGSAALAAGQLDTQVQLSGHDELHAAAENYNTLAGAVSQLVHTIQDNAVDLAAAADELNQVSDTITQKSGTQHTAAATIAVAIQQMTSSVDAISHSASEAQALSQQSGELSRTGAGEASGTASEIMRISDAVTKSSEQMDELGQRSQTITEIVMTIRGIAEQTNLLALNAAIEAARAGEAGRGFSIVADEVRKLAERTANSTQEISNMVAAIQESTIAATFTMQEGVACVTEGVQMANQAGNTMSRVSEESARVVETISHISSALEEQSRANADIARNIEQITQMTEENSAVAGQTTATAESLRVLASGLQAQVARFRV
ncbi:MAG: methyl-accepting chemotaxis protein [Burkholderiaceae bacterium]|nr:MAG: methyl-accepting chemotaxis protein [Burkholderiaceae bacterium]